MERMTLRKPLRDQPERARRGAATESLLGVRGAAGREAAGARKGRRDHDPVQAHEGKQDPARSERGRGGPGGFVHTRSRLKRVPISVETWVSVARAQRLRAIQILQTARSRTSAAT